MSRFTCALLISLGLTAPAVAQEPQASRVFAGTVTLAAASHSEVTAEPFAILSASSPGEPMATAVAASEPATGQAHHIRDVLTRRFGLARAKAEQISAAVMSSASKYSLPPALVLAIISIESRFQDHARGKNGATGLMQVVPAAHKRLVQNLDLTEPADNIDAGSAILHGYLQSARGDVGVALKNYGGSSAYARKVGLRAKDFEAVGTALGASTSSP